MRHTTGTLLLILLIQCAMVVAMYWPRPQDINSMARPMWQSADPGSVDKVRITDASKQELVLQKSGANWLLPGLHSLPADPEMVTGLLTALTSQSEEWPVAHSAAARQRFQVADYLFQRRIEFFSGSSALGTVYLGTSPGFRKVHARHAERDEIYATNFNVFDAPANDGDWIDARLLQIRTPMRVDADTYSIHREGGEWRSGSGASPDERELLALLSALRSLQVNGVANEVQTQQLQETEADLVLNIDSLSGKITLQLYRLAGVNFIRSSEYPVFFKLGNYAYDQLTSVDIERISGKHHAE